MGSARQSITTIAEKCKQVIAAARPVDRGLPESLGPKHLLWMCARIQQNALAWPESKLHRWLGFVQCGIMANRILDLEGTKALFEITDGASQSGAADQDLIDHLDPTNPFELDIGGEG